MEEMDQELKDDIRKLITEHGEYSCNAMLDACIEVIRLHFGRDLSASLLENLERLRR